MTEEIVDVDLSVLYVFDYLFHEPLEARRSPQQSHGRRDPLELAFSGHGEGGVLARLRLQDHLPESCREIDRGEECAAGLPNLVDALLNVFHGVFVFQGLGIECPEVLDQSKGTVLFHDTKQRAVELGSARLNYSELQPFGDVLLHLLSVSVGDLELLDVDWLLVAEFDVVKEGLGSPEVHLVLAHGRVVLENQVHVRFPEVLRDMLEVGGLTDVSLLLWSERLAQPPPGLLAAGDRGNKLRVDLFERTIVQVLGESQFFVSGDVDRRERGVDDWNVDVPVLVGHNHGRTSGQEGPFLVVDVDHAGHSRLGAPSGFGPNIALDEVDGVGVQSLGFLGPEGPLLPVIGLLPKETSGFCIVVQVEPVDEVDPENHVDSQIFDQHKVMSQGPVPNLDGHQVSTIRL